MKIKLSEQLIIMHFFEAHSRSMQGIKDASMAYSVKQMGKIGTRGVLTSLLDTLKKVQAEKFKTEHKKDVALNDAIIELGRLMKKLGIKPNNF